MGLKSILNSLFTLKIHGGLLMNKLTKRNLHFAWAYGCLFGITLVLAMTMNPWIFIICFFLIFGYVILFHKVLRCPHCKRGESLWNLTYAISHPYYCRYCGHKIIIEEEKNNDA